MPPKTRRARDGPTSMPSQSTISFKHKISKSSASQHIGKDAAKKSSASKNILNQPAQEIVVEAIRREQEPQTQKTEDTTKLVDESPVRIVSRSSTTPQKGKRRVRRSLNDDEPDTTFEQCEQKALGLTDSQIERYWQQEEDKRLAPRVHQKNLHLHEKILRHFDMCAEHGPCIGITRLQRWRRAQGLGSNPPIEVLATLLREEKAGSKRETGRIAYVDELCGGRDVLVD